MWIYTKYGFFSVVQHNAMQDSVLVRARVKQDADRIVALIEGSEYTRPAVEETPGRDYPYRLTVEKQAWGSVLYRLVMSMDYTNFKSAAHDGTDRDMVYMSVWSTMAQWQANRSRKPISRRGNGKKGALTPRPPAPSRLGCAVCGWYETEEDIRAGLNYLLCPKCESIMDLVPVRVVE